MSHTIIIPHYLEIFEPGNPEYEGIRDHFGPAKLARIDELLAKPEGYEPNFDERIFIVWAITKVIMTGD